MKNLLSKSRIILLLLCSISFISMELSAQTYFPLPSQNAYWTVYEWDENRLVYDDLVYTVDGDTLLNNLQYTKVYTLNDHPTIFDTIRTLHCFMRQDSIAKKIWFIRYYLGETTEKLGYDLAVNVGDTVRLPAFSYEWELDSVFILHIIYTNSVPLANGEKANYYSFISTNNSGRSIEFVEGISSFDNTFPDRYFFWDPFHQSYTMCMHENDNYLWPANTFPIDTTHCGFNLVDKKDIIKSMLKLYPNPADNYCRIELPNTFDKAELAILDLIGRPVYTQRSIVSNNPIIDVSQLPSGVYLIQIKINTLAYYNELVVKH